MKYKKLIFLIAYFFLFIFFIEALSYIYLKLKTNIGFPNYNIVQRTHYLDINKEFGPWHLANTEFNHITGCFNVNYKFNTIGARDENFNELGTKRFFLLGDSFAEGYGLDNENKIDVHIENLLKVNVMNFGTSGHFGTTQANILYKYFENKFEHDYVLHLISFNDFEDDDYNFGSNNRNTSERYRPYLIKKNNKYNLIYTGEFDNQKNKRTWLNVKSFLANFTNTFYFLKDLKRTVRNLSKENVLDKRKNFYEEFDQEIFDIFKYNFKQINEITQQKDRDYIIILVPDFYHLKVNTEIRTKLNKQLTLFAEENNIIFIDLLLEIKKNGSNIQKMYNTNDMFSCDGHTNNYGSKVISKIISYKISNLFSDINY